MRYARRTERVADPGPIGEAGGPAAWALHARALGDLEAGRLIAGRRPIVMSVGDPDMDTPAHVRAAAKAAIDAGDTHYAPTIGRDTLRALIARRAGEALGLDYAAENVAVAMGAQCALFMALLCLVDAGDEVIALDPMYVTYPGVVGATGARVRSAAADPDAGHRPRRATLEAALTPRTRAIMLASPGNPTGVMLTAEERGWIAEIARAHDLWVVSDEVYARTAFDRPHRSIAAEPGMLERTVVVDSLSKSHAMTGWRAGWMLGPAALIEHAENLSLCMLYGLPGFVQEAARAALADPAPEAPGWSAADEMRETYRRRRDAFCGALAGAPGLSVRAPEGGMFALIDVRATGLASSAFTDRLYAAQGVSLLDGAAFGASADGFVRASFALEEPALVEAAARIRAFAAAL